MSSLAARSLVGTWSLLSWEITAADGTVTEPIGANPVGRITYDDAHRMAVQVMHADRLRTDSGDPFRASPGEIVAAWMGFVSYAGHYETDPSKKAVIHHVEMCSFPNWVASSQQRFYSFEDDMLILSTSPISLGGESAVSTLIWELMDERYST